MPGRLVTGRGLAPLAASLFLAAVGGSAALARTGSQEKAADEPVAVARYLANAGVLIRSGETSVAFDPIFRRDYGQYQLLPPDLERALFAGEPPFDGLDAIFVSHYHEDHFSPADLRRLLVRHGELRLYAPAQAVASMGDRGEVDRDVFSRVTAIELAPGDPPLEIDAGPLLIEAVRVPHAGWPERNVQVHNLAYRVTLDERATVVHLGDADARDAHFEPHAAHWHQRHTHMAFPPFWFLLTPEGRAILSERIGADRVVGVHVPVEMPAEGATDGEHDLFHVPGETREIRPREGDGGRAAH